MTSRTFLVMAALAVVPGCGGAEQSSDAERHDIAPQSFVVELDRATTAEDAIPQILRAGRPQLATVCEEQPDASVRIFNPLASEAYTDVSCASVLDGSSATGEASAALHTDEKDGPTDEARQEIGPISFLMCGLFTGGTLLTTRYAICPRARNARSRQNCDDVGLWGGIAMGVVCSIPF